ncbi:cathepsin J [Sigmodon hispidus]
MTSRNRSRAGRGQLGRPQDEEITQSLLTCSMVVWRERSSKEYQVHLEEEAQRKAVWEKNMEMIKMHNGENGLGKNGFTMKMNAFGDMFFSYLLVCFLLMLIFWKTDEEYRKLMTDIPIPAAVISESDEEDLVNGFPKSVDWRKKGYVTPVQKQGKCGSCWAFAAAGAIEGQMFWKTGKLTPLSVQNLVDCSKPQGNNGCFGGNANKAFQYVLDNGGLEAEATYPYEGKNSHWKFKILYHAENSSAYITEFVSLPANEDYLLIAVASIGPVSAAIDASHKSFKFYDGGIYHEPNCSSYIVNHSVLVVGYGYEGNETHCEKFWLVKNRHPNDLQQQKCLTLFVLSIYTQLHYKFCTGDMTPAVFLLILCLGVASATESTDPILDAEEQEPEIKNEKLDEEIRRGMWEDFMKKFESYNKENSQEKEDVKIEMNAFDDLFDQVLGTLLVLSYCLSMASAAPLPDPNLDAEWEEWKMEFERTYSPEEEVHRRAVWEKNKEFIDKHNADYEQGKTSFSLGLNDFADKTSEEIKVFCCRNIYSRERVKIVTSENGEENSNMTPGMN